MRALRKSLFLDIFGGYLLVVLIVTSALTLFSLSVVREHSIGTLRNELKNLAITFSVPAAPLLDGRSTALDSLTRAIGRETGTRITVIDTLGMVLADSERDAETMESHSSRPEVIRAFSGGTGSSVRHSRTLEQEMLYVAVPIRADGRVSAVMRMSVPLSEVNALLAGVGRRILIVAAGLILLSLLAAYYLARRVSGPIAELVQASRRVGEGDLDARVSQRGRDELSELAGSFNEMVTKLKQSASTQASQREALSQVIGAIREGLVVLDHTGIIKLHNESFAAMVNQQNLLGRYHWEVTRDFRLGELLHNVDEGIPAQTAEVEAGNKHFICRTGFITSTRDVVITFSDVTEIKRLAKTKKDLVVNVSHELRTPLTSIKGYAETMSGTESEENRRYLEVILRHTERLIGIVQDMLTLAELEEKGVELHPEPIDLKALVKNVLKLFEPRFEGKGLDLRFEAREPLRTIRADPFKLEQVLVNLIDNALKYTDKGEIRVSLRQRGDEVLVEVADTGIGIARENLDKVFERFFVTDKARSRQQGGTGLGLAIAKHIVLLHGGRIETASEPGIGTKFTVILPASLP